MDRITTTIERQFLAAIIAGTKKVECRELKPYWTKRLAEVTPPFELRLINGMQARAPEVTVSVGKVRADRRNGVYELHIAEILDFKNWDKRRSRPIALARALVTRRAKRRSRNGRNATAGEMAPGQLRKLIASLRDDAPITASLERSLVRRNCGSGWEDRQKEHLLGWLKDYDGPGYYGRANWERSARFVFNHFQCPAGLLWLAETAGASRPALWKAKRAVLRAGRRNAAQAAAVRGIISWDAVEGLLTERAYRPRRAAT